ncbi:MAG TPA: branched-chain amino acid ABC transporter permease [Burkholderiales bacterium]|nr:branched-chain amino acid ABC transporter permease [Burkholderiales bacterium]
MVDLPLHRYACFAVVATGAALMAMPAVLPPYPLIEFSYALVLAIACLGLNLLYGTTGLLSLGHATFFGIGAYAGGFLFHIFDVQSLEAYLLTGALAAGALAAALGAFCVRVTRIQFTILTLAIGMIVHALFFAGIVFKLGGDYGKGMFYIGYGGIVLPRFTILGIEPEPEQFYAVFYYVILAAFAATLAMLWRINRSPFGLALRGIRDNDVRAEFIGIRLARLRWRAFVVSGLITGLAGCLYAQLDRQVTPQQLHWMFSATLVVAIILGGTREFLGPVVGAFGLVALQEFSRPMTIHDGLVLGVVLILVILALPGGVTGTITSLLYRGRRIPRTDIWQRGR